MVSCKDELMGFAQRSWMEHAFLMIIIFLSVNNVFGQQEFSSLRLGINSGIGISNIVGLQVSPPHHHRLGPLAGGTLSYFYHKRFSLQTGITYEVKGSQQRDTGSYVSQTFFEEITKYNHNYLVAHLLSNMHFLKIFYLGGGVYGGWLLRTTVIDTRADGSRVRFVLADSPLNPFDAGLILNAGISLPLAKTLGFNLEFRNNIGLLNVNRADSPIADGAPFRNSSYNILFSFLFDIE